MGAECFRVIARAIIVAPDGRIVLVTSQKGTALVAPGGAVDEHETLPQAAIREAQEECGLNVTLGRAIWLREFYDRKHKQANLEAYFLAQVASGAALPDRWQHADPGQPGLTRLAGLYSREELKLIEAPVYPVELRSAFWAGLEEGFKDVYLGRFES